MTEPEILEIFREESLERLDRMVEILLALESGSAPADALNSLFRHAHSIKGSAGMVGVSEAQLIARALEDVLEDVRDRGVLPRELTHPLLQAADGLRSAVEGTTDVAAYQVTFDGSFKGDVFSSNIATNTFGPQIHLKLGDLPLLVRDPADGAVAPGRHISGRLRRHPS